MQHLSLHLNAPYKCNECSYPITDTKTFFKHKQFYKHDEKTCIMIDNDINIPLSQQQSNATNVARRKMLIATRLKQHQAQVAQLMAQHQQHVESNELQLSHDKDVFKCSLCYSENDPAPSTSVSAMNKTPTQASHGASNLSFDKEQVLKHVLIVHLSFLAYKCDACPQFYAFDEPQTKQHAALVHQCGGEGTACHFKLIKTEEEINLAINRAQQFINKIPANSKKPEIKKSTQVSATPSTVPSTPSPNSLIEAQPKYKCCRCVITSGPIVLYSYQDALDHVMSAHLSSVNKKEKKVNYELELFEQSLEDLLASETGQTTVVNAASSTSTTSGDDENENEAFSDEDECGGEVLLNDQLFSIDSTEWQAIVCEPSNVTLPGSNQLSASSPALIGGGNRKKRFRTNNNTSISLMPEIGMKLKRFFYKPYFIYKCQLCSRKMSQFNLDHWLQHDREQHFK